MTFDYHFTSFVDKAFLYHYMTRVSIFIFRTTESSNNNLRLSHESCNDMLKVFLYTGGSWIRKLLLIPALALHVHVYHLVMFCLVVFYFILLLDLDYVIWCFNLFWIGGKTMIIKVPYGMDLRLKFSYSCCLVYSQQEMKMFKLEK